MARKGGDEGSSAKSQLPKKKQKEVDELFYTEGTAELKMARRWIASYSLQRFEKFTKSCRALTFYLRANERLGKARKMREQVNWEEELKKSAALRDTLKVSWYLYAEHLLNVPTV